MGEDNEPVFDSPKIVLRPSREFMGAPVHTSEGVAFLMDAWNHEHGVDSAEQIKAMSVASAPRTRAWRN